MSSEYRWRNSMGIYPSQVYRDPHLLNLCCAFIARSICGLSLKHILSSLVQDGPNGPIFGPSRSKLLTGPHTILSIHFQTFGPLWCAAVWQYRSSTYETFFTHWAKTAT